MSSDIEIRIKTIVDQAITDLGKVSEAIKGVGSTSTKTAEPVKGTGISLAGLSKFALAAAATIYATKKAYEATVGKTLDYAKEVKDLSRLLGISSEESSKLIQVSGDVEIGYGTLSSALEAGIRNGVKPNIEGIGKLSEEYLGIQDPIDKSAWLMKTFGKNGADMAPFLEMGPERIKALGIEAEGYGTILDDKAIGATIQFKDELDKLQNKWDGMVYDLGMSVIPALTDLITLLNNAKPATGIAGLIEQMRGAPSITANPATGIAGLTIEQIRGNYYNPPGYTHMASGGSGIVPSGYPNDSYLIGLSSRERFSVTPDGSKEDPTLKNVEKLLTQLVAQRPASAREIAKAVRDAIVLVSG